MSYKFWSGVNPGTGSRALLAFLVVLGTMSGATQSVAAGGRGVEFSGQLNYDTFQRAAAQNKSVRISYSPGGTGAAALALARVNKVIVDGQCNSACAWSFVRNAGACFTPRASFGFHAAHDPGTGRRINAATGYWLSTVRTSLRPRLEGLLSSSSLIRVSASEMRRYYGDRVCGAEPKTEVASKKAVARTVVASDETKRVKSRRAEQRVANLEVAASKAERSNSEGRRDEARVNQIEPGPWHDAFTRAAAPDTTSTTAAASATAVALLATPEMNATPVDPIAWSWLGEHGLFSVTDRSSIGVNDARASAAGAVAMAGLVLVGDELPASAQLDARIAALFEVVDATSETPVSFQGAFVCSEGSSCAEVLGVIAMPSDSGEIALDDVMKGGVVGATLQELAERQPGLIELSDESAGPCSVNAVREAALTKTRT